MRGCPEGLLDRERNPVKTVRNRAQSGLESLEMPKWGSPPSALGQNGKSGVASCLLYTSDAADE